MNTPIHDRALVDHFIANAFQPPVFVEAPPPPSRFDAELVVAGIEARAYVRARLGHLVQR